MGRGNVQMKKGKSGKDRRALTSQPSLALNPYWCGKCECVWGGWGEGQREMMEKKGESGRKLCPPTCIISSWWGNKPKLARLMSVPQDLILLAESPWQRISQQQIIFPWITDLPADGGTAIKAPVSVASRDLVPQLKILQLLEVPVKPGLNRHVSEVCVLSQRRWNPPPPHTQKFGLWPQWMFVHFHRYFLNCTYEMHYWSCEWGRVQAAVRVNYGD